MKGSFPGWFRWARRAGTRDFYPAMAVLVSLEQNIFFLAAHFFHFMCPHRPATWGVVSRAGSPIS
jgi:hypothetical protein